MISHIHIYLYVALACLNIQIASIIFVIKNFISGYAINYFQWIFFAILMNVGFLLYFGRGVDWYRILEFFQGDIFSITKLLRLFFGQLPFNSTNQFFFYWILVRSVFYYNIFILTYALQKNFLFRDEHNRNSLRINELMLVSFALFPVSTMVSFESATAMTFVLLSWLRVIDGKPVRWLSAGLKTFLIHPGGLYGMMLIKPLFMLLMLIVFFVLSLFNIQALNVLIEYAQQKFTSYIHGPWSHYAGVGELVSPIRAILLLAVLSILKLKTINYKFKKRVVYLIFFVLIICFSTVPFRSIYFRVGDPLIILTALRLASSFSSRSILYITSLIAFLSSPNIYWLIGNIDTFNLNITSITYFDQLKENILAGSVKNTYRGDLIAR